MHWLFSRDQGKAECLNSSLLLLWIMVERTSQTEPLLRLPWQSKAPITKTSPLSSIGWFLVQACLLCVHAAVWCTLWRVCHCLASKCDFEERPCDLWLTFAPEVLGQALGQALQTCSPPGPKPCQMMQILYHHGWCWWYIYIKRKEEDGNRENKNGCYMKWNEIPEKLTPHRWEICHKFPMENQYGRGMGRFTWLLQRSNQSFQTHHHRH